MELNHIVARIHLTLHLTPDLVRGVNQRLVNKVARRVQRRRKELSIFDPLSPIKMVAFASKVKHGCDAVGKEQRRLSEVGFRSHVFLIEVDVHVGETGDEVTTRTVNDNRIFRDSDGVHRSDCRNSTVVNQHCLSRHDSFAIHRHNIDVDERNVSDLSMNRK